MFPLQDTIRSRSFPAVNWLIIAGNLLCSSCWSCRSALDS
jgi:hypothetical protein